MLILSKHKDFYDSATIMVDKETVYDRKKEIIHNFNTSDYNFLHNDTPRDVKWEMSTEIRSPFVLGFCGKEYFGVVHGDNLSQDGVHNGTDVTYGHLPRPTKTDKFYYKEMYDMSLTVHGREKMNLFLEYKCPVYLIFRSPVQWKLNFITNPVLKNLDFGKISDSFTTFQEIHVFLREILLRGEQTVPVEVSENDRITSRGYDKWSFRRETHHRKPRNKKNNGN